MCVCLSQTYNPSTMNTAVIFFFFLQGKNVTTLIIFALALCTWICKVELCTWVPHPAAASKQLQDCGVLAAASFAAEVHDGVFWSPPEPSNMKKKEREMYTGHPVYNSHGQPRLQFPNVKMNGFISKSIFLLCLLSHWLCMYHWQKYY